MLMGSIVLDAIDRDIVALLQSNGRLSQEQIAQKVNLSRPAVHERIKRLEEQDILRGYQAIVDWGALGLSIAAFIFVRVSTVNAPFNDTGATIIQIHCPDALITECHRITGEWCMLVKARVASPLALQNVLDAIRAVPGVQETMTTMILSTLLE
jgi:Lrp/AsnC family leucine-responsive transcriptional regulator